MSNTFKLSAIRSAAEKKYAPLQIDVSENEDGSDLVDLIPVMRLSPERRRRVEALQKNRAEGTVGDFDGLEEFLREFITAVASSDARGKKLLDVVGSDIAFLAQIVEEYSERTQPGEASSSES